MISAVIAQTRPPFQTKLVDFLMWKSHLAYGFAGAKNGPRVLVFTFFSTAGLTKLRGKSHQCY